MAAEQVVLETIVTGGPQVVATLDAETAATDRLAASTERTGIIMTRTARRGFMMNQMLFTMRRLMYMSTLAFIASGLVMLHWGWQFNNTMQQGRVILTRFTGSTALANQELNHLFNLAAYAPFQFQDLVKGAAVMYAFGFTTKEVNRTMQDLVDALTATGRATPAALNRVSQALGHMMSMGTATGQVLNQIARDGIPGVYKAVEKYFKIDSAQAHHIGALGLPSTEVLKAIQLGIEQSKLHGIARKMQESTLKGVFTTFKDFSSQIIGNFEQKPFDWLQGMFNKINPALQRMQKGFKKGGFSGMWEGLTQGKPTGWEKDLALLGSALANVWHILVDGVIPAVREWFNILKPVFGILLILNGALGFLAKNAWLVKIVVFAMTAEWIRARGAMLAFFITGGTVGEVTTASLIARLGAFIATLKAAWVQLIRVAAALAVGLYWWALYFYTIIERAAVALVWETRMAIALGIVILEENGLTLSALAAAVAMGVEAAASWAMISALYAMDSAMAALDFFLLLDPITWIVLAIIGLTFALYELITHWKQVKRWVLDNWVGIGAILGGPFTLLAYLTYQVFDRIQAKIGSVINWIINKAKEAGKWLKKIFDPFGIFDSGPSMSQAFNQKLAKAGIYPGSMTPSLQPAGGGTLSNVGPAPFATSPINPYITPNTADGKPTQVNLMVDGKKMAEVVFNHKDDVRARR